VIKEDAKSPGDTICRQPRHGRQRVVYVSRGSLVEVRLATSSSSSSRSAAAAGDDSPSPEYFLVEFQGLFRRAPLVKQEGLAVASIARDVGSSSTNRSSDMMR